MSQRRWFGLLAVLLVLMGMGVLHQPWWPVGVQRYAVETPLRQIDADFLVLVHTPADPHQVVRLADWLAQPAAQRPPLAMNASACCLTLNGPAGLPVRAHGHEATWHLSHGSTAGRVNTAKVSVYRVVQGLPQPISYSDTVVRQWVWAGVLLLVAVLLGLNFRRDRFFNGRQIID